MSHLSTSLIGPSEVQTRFVYPFFVERLRVHEASTVLQTVSVASKAGKLLQVWEGETPHDLYREEILGHVVSFLFPGLKGGGDCTYLKLSPVVGNLWFNKLEAVYPHSASRDHRAGEVVFPIRLLPTERIELFLLEYGVGVLSAAIGLARRDVSFNESLEFNYRLSQGRTQTAAHLRIPHPADHADQWAKLSDNDKARVPGAPGRDAPVREQLGRPGGTFTLYELIRELLQPLEQLGFRSVLDELSVYTIARFSEEVDLDVRETSATLAPFLSALAQIEEPGHAGQLQDAVGVTNAILNRKHWAAVGLLGSAHIVADQSPADHPFNSARVPRVLLKYFMPYLLALLQRIALDRTIDEAGTLVFSTDHRTRAGLANVRKHLLEFAVRGYFTAVSNREVLHRYYRMCQQGLDVQNTLHDARQAIADLDATNAAENQAEIAAEVAKNVAATRNLQEDMARNVEATKGLQERMTEHLGVVARVQMMVEWLEVFVVSVAAADLWHIFSADNKGWFPIWASKLVSSRESFVSWGALLSALVAGILALLVIQPWRHGKRRL
ncbi:MAG TPA: hypothetical protein VI386_35700 [Candidatus Sulfotelmatobacter sp.]